MNKETRRELFNKDCEELGTQCTNLTEQMEAYMSNDLDYHTVLTLKERTLSELFEIQNKITEIDGTYDLLDADDLQSTNDHANLVELLLGTLEQLETIFNK